MRFTRWAAACFGAWLALAACGEDDGSDPEVGSGYDSGAGGAAGTVGYGGAAGGGGSAATSGTAGSGGAAGNGAAGAAASAGAGAAGASFVDADGDGLDDAFELSLASNHYPYYSIHPDDKCPRHGVLFRATPHPDDAARVMIWYVVLFENDCGLTAHVGDDEVFGVVLDPALPPGQSILAVRAISHQGTWCEKVTTCGSLPDCKPCTFAQKGGVNLPVVFASVNKHGQFTEESSCDLSVICDMGGCALNPTPASPPFVNAGEPGKPLVNDLTLNGFITAANGWTKTELMGFDPWANQEFGSAGDVTDDLTDPAFVVPLSGCK
jgi:hypothetical protein